ncbi:hypothetical protein DEO72_LG3g807 [Vigna unguiculata]|uniref:Uncharacterized protein n=1 Tax=Vigna unguiculata TaxID=3917 RepID=A0A4D6LD14_VIGUN|nr:hypothetical protein DEO72_LG3g807 [Vigna unguiculata]
MGVRILKGAVQEVKWADTKTLSRFLSRHQDPRQRLLPPPTNFAGVFTGDTVTLDSISRDTFLHQRLLLCFSNAFQTGAAPISLAGHRHQRFQPPQSRRWSCRHRRGKRRRCWCARTPRLVITRPSLLRSRDHTRPHLFSWFSAFLAVPIVKRKFPDQMALLCCFYAL